MYKDIQSTSKFLILRQLLINTFKYCHFMHNLNPNAFYKCIYDISNNPWLKAICQYRWDKTKCTVMKMNERGIPSIYHHYAGSQQTILLSNKYWLCLFRYLTFYVIKNITFIFTVCSEVSNWIVFVLEYVHLYIESLISTLIGNYKQQYALCYTYYLQHKYLKAKVCAIHTRSLINKDKQSCNLPTSDTAAVRWRWVVLQNATRSHQHKQSSVQMAIRETLRFNQTCKYIEYAWQYPQRTKCVFIINNTSHLLIIYIFTFLLVVLCILFTIV